MISTEECPPLFSEKETSRLTDDDGDNNHTTNNIRRTNYVPVILLSTLLIESLQQLDETSTLNGPYFIDEKTETQRG